MLGFDVLDPSLNLKKNYFLEASAGTGKTFTLENIVIRLLQDGVPIEKILVLTFTRAAALELKMRIRTRLEERQMFPILAAFDDAQIFTIHGFCFQILKDHAFATGFSLMGKDQGASACVEKKILKDFLRTQLFPEEIHPKQIEKLLWKGRNEIDGLIKHLKGIPSQVGRSYHQICADVEQTVKQIDWKPCLEEWIQLASSFKGFFDRQGKVYPEHLEGFAQCENLFHGQIENLVDLPLLKMTPEHLKTKHTYSEKLKRVQQHLIPLLQEASDANLILGRLAMRAKAYIQSICENEDLFFYDDLLTLTEKNLENDSFVTAVRHRYEAALIDEFQDTDSIQWKIFSTLFLNQIPLFLVGDPKQSIYRFRGANLYSYLEAKEALGEDSYATLTRNFRSQPSLIGALNSLFERANNLIVLPKTHQSITILPIAPALPDERPGKVTFTVADTEESLFLWIIEEIERLHREEGIPYRECAVLVKDRFQAKRFCSLCSLPYQAKRSESLLESPAFSVLEDLLKAVLNPRERRYLLKVLGGPLFCVSLDELSEKILSDAQIFFQYHQLLNTKGIIPFFQSLSEEISFPSLDLYLDLWQLVEMIAENSCGEYLPYLQKLKLEDPEADCLKARLKCEEDAIQIMTLHVSKGLEFEITFPIGLMKETDMKDPEDLSESMRQLYVAMTRAKRYLYLPVVETSNSPMQFFLQKVLQGDFLENFVANHPHFSLVKCPSYPLTSPSMTPQDLVPDFQIPSRTVSKLTFPPCEIHSYSSLNSHALTPSILSHTSDEMPGGTETGILLHQIFETINFNDPKHTIFEKVSKQLEGTHLCNWIQHVQDIVQNTLHATLKGFSGDFCLFDVDPKKMIREMEFIYSSDDPSGYIKGFIDLFFEHQGAYYCLDWKSNALIDYSPQTLQDTITVHQYDLQAQIYHRAAKKYLNLFQQAERFAGSFYLFLRGLREGSAQGIYFFPKEK